jgi:hypothetical protein
MGEAPGSIPCSTKRKKKKEKENSGYYDKKKKDCPIWMLLNWIRTEPHCTQDVITR